MVAGRPVGVERPVRSLLALSAAVLCSCGGAAPQAAADTWRLELADLDAALLSVAPLDATSLITVGGPLLGVGPPALYRKTASEPWAALSPPPGWLGAAWWAHAVGPDDVWVVGARLQIARGRPDALALLPLPPIPSATVATLYGVWGASADDVWAVGGSPNDATGPSGVILHWDGTSLRRVPLTGTASTAARETLFKVWGASSTDVHVVGSGGTALHWDGGGWSRLETGTHDRLLTVHGRSAGEVYAVGGNAQGVVLRYDGARWGQFGPTDLPPLNGVHAGAELWVAGIGGFLAKAGGDWPSVADGLFGRDLHGVWSGPSGTYAAGGQLVVEPGSRRGLIGRFGPAEGP